jgi:hypothetical protein
MGSVKRFAAGVPLERKPSPHAARAPVTTGSVMERVRRRVTDKRVLALIRRFLAAGIMREHGTLAATPSGTPQGSGLSPLPANIALSVLDRHFEKARAARRWHSQRARDRATATPASGDATASFHRCRSGVGADRAPADAWS